MSLRFDLAVLLVLTVGALGVPSSAGSETAVERPAKAETKTETKTAARARAKAGTQAFARTDLPAVKYEKYTLANGLEVILHEDHSTPVVGVDVWYHVGSKNERPGRTGFAHLFEHMMFQGSRNWDDDFFKPIQEAGGTVNGSTNTDRTNYWELVPSNFLARALWLEADRMGFLLDAMTQKKLDNQRDVVKNERRQRYENEPYGRAREVMVEAAYPAKHPYSWLTIGSMEDLSAASLDDVKDFFRRFYTPSNATLVITGDFEPKEAKRLVEASFGALPPGPPVWKFAEWTPRLEGEVRVVLQDRVQLPRTYLLWHTTRAFSPDDAALDVLASILGQGKSSRLYDRLVYQKSLAQDVSAYQDSREISGAFNIVATARPGVELAALEKEIDAAVARMSAEGPSPEELERAKNGFEAQFVRGLQEVGGFSGIADRLNYYNHYVGEPDYFRQDLERYRNVTAAAVRDVARKYLGPHRVVLHVDPMPALKPSDSEIAKGIDRAKLPEGTAAQPVKLPLPARRTLANGLELLVIEHHELPVLGFSLVVPGGSASDPPGAPGLANLTAQMLDEGTATRKALDIARGIDRIGASLELSTDHDSSGASLWTLKAHAEEALGILADVLLHPTFPEEELDRVRKQLTTRLLQERDQPNAIANRTTARVLYGEAHPYGHLELGTKESLEGATRADVEGFYRRAWRPDGATLIVAGDTTPDAAARMVEKALGGWEKAEVPRVALEDPVAPKERTIYLVNKPGAAQTTLVLAQAGLPRSSADYFPALVLNAAFGGMFSSRLNMNLREDKGYTYGARSAWSFRRGAGHITVSAPVQTKVTKEALAEMLREVEEVRGARPIDAKELEFAKGYLVRQFPQRFETPEQIAERYREVVLYGLPPDFFNGWIDKVSAVTPADVARVARERLRPDALSIVVVGDVEAIRKGLEELKAGRIVELDAWGTPIAAAR